MDCNPPFPPSMGFFKPEYWSRLPFPSPGDLPNPVIRPLSPAWQADFWPLNHLGSPCVAVCLHEIATRMNSLQITTWVTHRHDKKLDSILPSGILWKWKSLSPVRLFVTPLDYTVHGILQARILEWVAFPFSRGSSQPKDRTQVFCIVGRLFIRWATKEVFEYLDIKNATEQVSGCILLNYFKCMQIHVRNLVKRGNPIFFHVGADFHV